MQAGVAFGGWLQTVLQLPQWDGSFARSTHCPLQFVLPVGHDTTHCPPEHAWFLPHVLPQAPQFALSDSRFTQLPLQSV